MKDHYQLTEKSYNELEEKGVTFHNFFHAIPFFDPIGSGSEISFVSLLYYIDKKGDFNKPPFFPHKKIARALFEQLPIKEKIAVAEYIDEGY